jgi:thiamine biosynthesis lipoprotein
MAAERSARAMGTDVHVIVIGDARLADTAMGRIADLESRWSRFRPSSEVSRLNRAGGAPVEVSPDTITLVRRGRDAWRVSAAFVDCTELAAVIAAGYDRSFEHIPADRAEPPRPPRGPGLIGPADIVVDGTTVTLPPDVGLDPGGIGKGLAADIVAGEVMAAGAEGVCVDIGGDLRVDGIGPEGAGWTVSIDHPHHPTPLAIIALTSGAVASSTTLKRRWRIKGEDRHHLIDPRTGRPSESDVVFATAIAAEGWLAEAMAKGVLLRGGVQPFEIVEGTGVEALVVDHDGAVRTSAGFARFTDGTPIRSLPERVGRGVST